MLLEVYVRTLSNMLTSYCPTCVPSPPYFHRSPRMPCCAALCGPLPGLPVSTTSMGSYSGLYGAFLFVFGLSIR